MFSRVFIVWGTKIKRKRLGRVAEFCPICRKARAHVIRRIGEASHVYYVSFGQGSLVGHETECETCHLRDGAEIRDYAQVSQNPLSDVDELISETYPNFRESYSDRFAIEAKIAAGTLAGEDRTEALREPFFMLEPMIERNRAEPESSPMGKKVGYFTLFTGLAFVLAVVLAARADQGLTPVMKNVLAALLVLLGAGMLATFYFLAARHPWFMKNRIRPQLLSALTPLQPTEEELTETLAFCKQSGLRIGKKIKALKLHAWLQERQMLAPLQTRDV